jgi:hypothetical protein
MARNKHHAPLRVTLYSTIGGGFGFAFGTFFHLVMNWVEIPFNTWNMAEYAIGFFGGIGLAYGVFSSKWPEKTISATKWENVSAFLIAGVLVPIIIFRESFSFGMFMEKYEQLANTETIATLNTTTAVILITLLILVSWVVMKRSNFEFAKKIAVQLFLLYSTVYALLSYIASGIFMGTFWGNSNHHLYLVNIIAIIFLAKRKIDAFVKIQNQKIETKQGIYVVLLLLVLIAGMAWLSIQLHGETGPQYDRFPMG